MTNFCYRCNGSGKIQDLKARWWQFWKQMICPVCKGNGYANPPLQQKPRYPFSEKCDETREERIETNNIFQGVLKEATIGPIIVGIAEFNGDSFHLDGYFRLNDIASILYAAMKTQRIMGKKRMEQNKK